MVTEQLSIIIDHADLGYNHHVVLKDIDYSIDTSVITCLMGPNGVGKTTLFRTLLGALPPLKGSITINGRQPASLEPRTMAKWLAYVPQAHQSAFPYSVLDVVLFGRTAHISRFGTPDKNDRRKALAALDFLDIGRLAGKSYSELSGGERQLVLIARALSQEASFLLMDEPTSNLDYGNQCLVLQKIKQLNEQHIGVLMATHSPDHAFMVGSQVVVLKGEGIHKMGPPEQVLTCEVLRRTFGVNVQLLDVPAGRCAGRKTCTPSMY